MTVAHAAAPPRPPLTVVLPPAAAEEDRRLALLVQERAAQLPHGAQYDDVHVKQVLRMAEHEGLDLSKRESVPDAAMRLAAKRFVWSRLVRSGGALSLEWTLAGQPMQKRALQGELPRQVEDGGRALAEAVAKADKIALAPATPLVVPAGALADYGVCYQILIRQPIGVETPTVLSVPELGQAVKRCRAATEAAPTFDAAWAALGLGLAISGEDAEAVKSLLRVKDKNAWLPLWWLGRCWVVTRHISVEAGADVLGQAVKTHPGFLLARGYLAEHHGALRRADAAYNAWSTYLERVPDSGYIRGRMSSLLAKLGRHDEAIARAREAASRDPAARDAQLELASRQLDACHHADAIALFKPLAAAERPRAEVLLRLGYAQLLSGDLAAAEASLERALKNATHPSEWRTRGHALADLARVYLKRSDSVRAEEMILAARQADLLPVVLAQNDPELKKLVERTSPKPKKLSLDLPRMVKPRELSPFAIDAAGQVDPNQRGFGTPPSSVELLRF